MEPRTIEELRQEIGRVIHESDRYAKATAGAVDAIEAYAKAAAVLDCSHCGWGAVGCALEESGCGRYEPVAFVRSRSEILHDIEMGIVPSNVRSFSELHDYVDANEYGGVTVETIHVVQALVDLWLATRIVQRRDMDTPHCSTSPVVTFCMMPRMVKGPSPVRLTDFAHVFGVPHPDFATKLTGARYKHCVKCGAPTKRDCLCEE